MAAVLLTCALAVLGAAVGRKCNVPAGVMLGSLLGVGIFQLFTGMAALPSFTHVLISVLTGTFLGTRVSRKELSALRHVLKPALISLPCMMAVTFFNGLLLSRLAGFDLLTGLLAAAPGGVGELALAAVELGANGTVVSVVQVCRLFLVMSTAPALIKLALGKKEQKTGEREKPREAQGPPPPRNKSWGNLGLTLLVGAAGGMLGMWSGFPSGTMVLSMMAVIAFNLWTQRGYVPPVSGRVAQCGNGALMGIRLVLGDLLLIRDALPHILLFSLGWVVFGLVMGTIYYRRNYLSPPTALLGSVIGGLNETSLLALDYGGNPVQVSAMQLSRVIGVLTLYPNVFGLVAYALAG